MARAIMTGADSTPVVTLPASKASGTNVAGASHAQLRQLARQRGHRLLREDGLLKAWQGVASVDEVLRVISG